MSSRVSKSLLALCALFALALVGCSSESDQQAALQSTPGLTCPSPVADQCPSQVYNQPLQQPREIRPVNGLIDTSLTVQKRTNDCVPAFINKQWEWCQMDLRTYGSPADPNNPNDTNLEWTLPGPTYRVQKAVLQDASQPPGPQNPEVEPGTRLKILLKNQLPNSSYQDCRPVYYCQGNGGLSCTPGGDECGSNGPCVELQQTAPNCYHGPDVTNLHLHGSHVSPQPYQDFVLLSLFSSQQTNPPPPCQPGNCPFEDAVGQYPINVNPFPWNQAPGTHWYHPHKHGSTATQVLNGMAGALLVEGPFDDWLYGFYGVDPANSQQLETFEKLLVVQQVWTDAVFFTSPLPTGYPPTPLVNGQANPVIQMRLGEVQRWRFIGATVQSAAQIEATFPEDYVVSQIAQDGVQFAPENYGSQPLYQGSFTLSPGNRADFLVKAPATYDGTPAFVTYRSVGSLVDNVRSRLRDQTQSQRDLIGLSADANVNALFTIQLVDEPADMPWPTESQWPPMPYYLRDVEGDDLPQRTIAYSMTGSQASLPNGFWINNVQYQSGCANETMTLETAEEWTLTNSSAPQHPFHIHTNPFQLISKDSTSYDAPYVWMDTIALPNGSQSTSQVIIRHRFEDYSGVYVNHCHFLGHEDRGMMINLQTICSGGQFGTPQANGGADDCSVPSGLITPNPFPACGSN